jgi:phosphatidylglycerophosphate synthase
MKKERNADIFCLLSRPPLTLDRCATACLLCFLAMANPSYALVFQFLIALDFASHYMHMYRCVLSLVLLPSLRFER